MAAGKHWQQPTTVAGKYHIYTARLMPDRKQQWPESKQQHQGVPATHQQVAGLRILHKSIVAAV